MLYRRLIPILALFMVLLALGASSLLTFASQAAPAQQDATPQPQVEATPSAQPEEQLSISNEVCLSCHGKPGTSMTLEDGSTLELYVTADEHQNSVHGKTGIACVQCHRTVGNYPHPPFSAQDGRDASLQLYNACKYCHSSQYNKAQDGVHANILASGQREAAICTDCHTAHSVRRIKDPKTHEELPGTGAWTAETCGRCHSAIYEKYKESVHGAALIGEGNPDVPTCINCHGVHNIEDPRTTTFRVESPAICANCHTDEKIMNKYGISTEVLNTYVADFHGTTDVLFNDQSEDAQFNKPVCYDCHGVHDIRRPDDPYKGLQVRENLLARCQECHPDASNNFPDAWLSHYIPSPSRNQLVFYVDLFYKILIPTVVGGMGLLVVMDFSRRSINRYRRRNPAEEQASGLVSGDQHIETPPATETGLASKDPNDEGNA